MTQQIQTHAELRDTLEKKQDEQFEAKNGTFTPIDKKIEVIANKGFKIADIKKAFYDEELKRKQVEAERDDNLQAYLAERKEKNELISENENLKKVLEGIDLKKAEQTEARQRKEQYSYDAQKITTNLWNASRNSFNEMLKNPRGNKWTK